MQAAKHSSKFSFKQRGSARPHQSAWRYTVLSGHRSSPCLQQDYFLVQLCTLHVRSGRLQRKTYEKSARTLPKPETIGQADVEAILKLDAFQIRNPKFQIGLAQERECGSQFRLSVF